MNELAQRCGCQLAIDFEGNISWDTHLDLSLIFITLSFKACKNDQTNSKGSTNISDAKNDQHNDELLKIMTDVIQSLDRNMCKMAEHITTSQYQKTPNSDCELTVLKSIDAKLTKVIEAIDLMNIYPQSIDTKLTKIADTFEKLDSLPDHDTTHLNSHTDNTDIEKRLSAIEERLSAIESNPARGKQEERKDVMSAKPNQNNDSNQETKKVKQPQKANDKCKAKSSSNDSDEANRQNNTNKDNKPGRSENEKKGVRKFRGRTDPLSNLYIGKHKIKIENQYYIATEQYYHCENAKHHNRPDLKIKIEKSNNTKHIFNLGKNITPNKEWNQKRRATMKKALEQKYIYVPEFREALAQTKTKNEVIVEDTYDPYWGYRNGGLNVMGKLLMEVRDNPPSIEDYNEITYVPNDPQYKTVMCIVDSNGSNLDFRRTLPMNYSKVRKCHTIDKAIEVVQDEESEPQYVLVHTGTNDLINCENPAGKYIELIDEIKKKWPTASLIISKLLPRGGSKISKKLKIFNNTIENKYLFSENIELIDHSDLLWGEEPNYSYYIQEEKAGRLMPLLHLNNAGLANLASKFRYTLKKLS